MRFEPGDLPKSSKVTHAVTIDDFDADAGGRTASLTSPPASATNRALASS
jgi:hypothetical protein